ncbi:pyruvate dehydrogenase (acetyl-transferring) E1 component subunit alpha [Sedimenticola selenatireducens]|uniref:Pyruvate dehydrogenase E1 component subunit alpha n=1 Tax=Sedimenticola selenatireducens TaxID=191960 RepID=A0A557SJU6_9GAMM|nr:pyruvate dehydrogenase (acetyl-transferring) E1 component subunit alpha [Sedimenticola selenatireducens]TVO77701.1 pyruvate dehydrogenase (acetyl-transferring) E1 component subunit alpha [Sedimenticola selenatireducens]TVT65007.1 MAG: pyruvate dehydrogenase (acetyl-transferring) E1 component subunit alpha [Sedimenticola selenatireducens]
MNKTASFKVDYYQYLQPNGEPEGELPPLADDTKTIHALYRNMLFTRLYDERAVNLQRTGQIGTFASSLGQEAIGAGVGHAMQPNDIITPSFRESGALFFRGFRVYDLLLYWGGDERGMSNPEVGDDFPICVPISTHATHAAGAAFAVKYRKEPRVVVCILGDGGTSKGDFYEAINLAGVWNLPLVFVINNNQWAISVPRAMQSKTETLAQKAIAAGIPGIQIDGNDPIAVRHHVAEAIENARSGGGPTLIEAISYRLCHHTTADDATRYRSDEELEAQRKFDPIPRLKVFMNQRGIWSDDQEKQLLAQCKDDIEKEVRLYLDSEPQAPSSMFDSLYAELPDELTNQRQSLLGKE